MAQCNPILLDDVRDVGHAPNKGRESERNSVRGRLVLRNGSSTKCRCSHSGATPPSANGLCPRSVLSSSQLPIYNSAWAGYLSNSCGLNPEYLAARRPKFDLLEDRWVGSPVDAVIDSNVRDETANILKTLSPKEEKVIRLRFGIGCEREHTLEEIGQEFDVTRERIRQIEAKALRQLRSPERARHLRALLAAR
jgi:RNA polymerase sigma factor (sigma-70 family)